MHLTNVLCRFMRRRHIPGNVWRGKNRFELRVTNRDKVQAARQLVFEQRNLEQLNNPYITEEEEQSYVEVEERRREEKRLKDIDEKVKARMFKHRGMVDYLDGLKATKQWE